MEDRFKFRVWNGNEDVTKLLCFMLSDNGNLYHEDGDSFRMCEVGEVVEQCTGLKDKNDKLIYEGDILNVECFDKPFSATRKMKIINHVVIWCSDDACFYPEVIGGYGVYRFSDGDIFPNSCIIGNIHQNPELLGA